MYRPDPEGGTGSATAEPAEALAHPVDAAQWFARMHSGEVTDADRQAFSAWCDAHPDHEREYRKLTLLWRAALAVPEDRLLAMTREVPLPCTPRTLTRRHFGLALGGLGMAIGALCIASSSRRSKLATDTYDLMTRKGERSHATLPDGSLVHLNSNTRIDVYFSESERLVKLRRGEVFFDVQHDAARPFVVHGRMGQVRVTGTRFNVRRDPGALQVSVESGSVLLRARRGWLPEERRLSAGQQAVAYADNTLGDVTEVNVGNLVAWQRGRVIFNGVPLGEVIEEMNRYLTRPARLQAPALSRHKVSGIFSVDDPEAMIDALPAIVPVLVRRLGDGEVVVVAR